MIIKRKDVDIFSGMWDVPGGKIESEDTLSGAIAREIKEETGLKLTKILLIFKYLKIHRKPRWPPNDIEKYLFV